MANEKKQVTDEILRALFEATEEQKEKALDLLLGRIVPVPEVKAEIEPFISLKECGRRLGVSPCSLWRWGVPGHELGGRPRYRLGEVVAYLESDAFKTRAAQLTETRCGKRGKRS